MPYNPERSVMRRVGVPAAFAAGALTLAAASFELADRTKEQQKPSNKQEQALGDVAVRDCLVYTPRGPLDCDALPAEPEPTPSRLTPAPTPAQEKEKPRAKELKHEASAAEQPEPAAAERVRYTHEAPQRASRSRQRRDPGITDVSLYEKFERLAECESSGNWQINTGNGFYGGIQFMEETWDNIGGERYADRPDQATKDQQIAMGIKLYKLYGDEQWPVCGDRAGL